MKVLGLFILGLALLYSTNSFSQSKCSDIKCPQGATQVEIRDGVKCTRSGSNMQHGPKCVDHGFQNGSNLGRELNITTFKDGKRNGKSYLKIGNVITREQSFKDNVRHGRFVERDPKTGKNLVLMNYNDGKSDGEYLEYDKRGQLLDRSMFDMGKTLIENLYRYYRNGKLKKSTSTKNPGKRKTISRFDEKGKLISESYFEDDVEVWSKRKDSETGELKKIIHKKEKSIGSCHVKKVNGEFQLLIGTTVFARSHIISPLLEAIENKKDICNSFKKDQSTKGCEVTRKIKSSRPNAPLKVNNQFESQNSGMMISTLADALEGTYNLSSAGLCNKLSEHKCRASFHEPPDIDKENPKFKISVEFNGKKHTITPRSSNSMYYISRIFFSSKCQKEYHRGKHCSIRSIDADKVEITRKTQYELLLGQEVVQTNSFYRVDDPMVGWNKKFCQDGKVNSCKLDKVVDERGNVNYSLFINGEVACDTYACSSRQHRPGSAGIETAKSKFQDEMIEKYPKFILKHGCFYPEGLAEKFLNGVADRFVDTEREKVILDIQRRIASDKLSLGENNDSENGEGSEASNR
ncbi:MAG: hypothetical protein KC493_16525 [Bacteriovoracaceae bacterium]|nr:hypothetical protein [Bacteriovoracaceae bacterium]